MLSMVTINWVLQNRLLLKPCCLSERIFSRSKWSITWLCITYSSTLHATDVETLGDNWMRGASRLSWKLERWQPLSSCRGLCRCLVTFGRWQTRLAPARQRSHVGASLVIDVMATSPFDSLLWLANRITNTIYASILHQRERRYHKYILYQKKSVAANSPWLSLAFCFYIITSDGHCLTNSDNLTSITYRQIHTWNYFKSISRKMTKKNLENEILAKGNNSRKSRSIAKVKLDLYHVKTNSYTKVKVNNTQDGKEKSEYQVNISKNDWKKVSKTKCSDKEWTDGQRDRPSDRRIDKHTNWQTARKPIVPRFHRGLKFDAYFCNANCCLAQLHVLYGSVIFNPVSPVQNIVFMTTVNQRYSWFSNMSFNQFLVKITQARELTKCRCAVFKSVSSILRVVGFSFFHLS